MNIYLSSIMFCAYLSCSMSRYVQAALSSVDYEDYVRNESEIKEKMASIKKELKVMKISEQITDKVPQKPLNLNKLF